MSAGPRKPSTSRGTALSSPRLPLLGVALAAVAGMFAMHTWSARRRDRKACFRAFLDNNYVGLVLWLGIGVATLQR